MGKQGNMKVFESFLSDKEIPLLTLDERWHQLFLVGEKPIYIDRLEEELNALLKYQSKVITELKELSGLKRNLLQEIVMNMQETIESEEAFRQKKLIKARKIIKEINMKLQNLEEDYGLLPKRIEDKNKELLLAGIKEFYGIIKNNEKELIELNIWIEQTRKELMRKVVVVEEKEAVNSNIYSYMHDLLGPNYMEYFDSNYGV